MREWITLLSGSHWLLWQVDHRTSGSQKGNGCWITGLLDHRNIKGCWIAQNKVPHAGTISHHSVGVIFSTGWYGLTYRLLLVWAFKRNFILHLLVRFRTSYRWICACGLIMPVWNRTEYHCLSTFWYDFFTINPNCWNDFRPIIATTVRIAGTMYRLSLVQTY